MADLEKKQGNILSRVSSKSEDKTFSEDAVFGELNGDGPNYRSAGWMATTVVMLKSQIGMGVLSIPAAFDALGIVPGVICLCVITGITTWANYLVGVFKLRHPEVYSIDDVGGMLFGKPGKVLFGTAFVLWCTFVSGSGMLGISLGLNTVSSHATCTAAYIAVAAIVTCSLASIQTLARISWLAWVGLTCILTSILIVTIAVGLQDRPSTAPQTGVWVSDYKIVNNPPFSKIATALSTIVFAMAGTPTFFSIVSEMREPRYYTRSMMFCQTVMSTFYIAVGIVIYYYCGSYVTSPALGSTSPTIKKVSYGFALPSLVVGTLLFIHLPAKYMFVRLLYGSKHLSANTLKHWITWLGCTISVSLVAYIVASAIPVFGNLVSLIGAVFGTPLCFQPIAGMWLYDNWNKSKSQKSTRWVMMVVWCIFVIISGTFLMIGGTYGSIVSIIDDYKVNQGSAAWSCADNSNR